MTNVQRTSSSFWRCKSQRKDVVILEVFFLFGAVDLTVSRSTYFFRRLGKLKKKSIFLISFSQRQGAMREDIFRSKSGKWPMPNFQMVSPKSTASLYSSVCIRFQGDSSHKIKVSLPSVFLREANSFAEIANFRWQRRKWNGPDHRNREAFWETYSSAKKHFHQLEKKLDLEEANLHFYKG